MAITSKGYTGSVNNVDWSVLADKLGAQFAVFGADAFELSAAVGDRALTVRAGEATGQGIRDISDSSVTLTGSPVTAGDRWDMVALRRDWTTRTSVLVIVPGTSVKTLPAARERTIGSKVDHPLWLVRFSAGQSALQERIDLRVWHGDGGVVARDLLVREFMDRVGTVIRVGDDEWARILGPTGQATWRRVSGPPQGGALEAVLTGTIAQPGSTNPLLVWTVPSLVPAGALLHVRADLEIWIPTGQTFAGFAQVRQGDTNVIGQRRWSNHYGRNQHYLYTSVEVNIPITQDIPAGTDFRFVLTSDGGSAGGVEAWHAYASWAVTT